MQMQEEQGPVTPSSMEELHTLTHNCLTFNQAPTGRSFTSVALLIVQPKDACLQLLIVSCMSWLWELCDANKEAFSDSVVF